MRQWRLIISEPASGARNMALDEALLLEVSAQPVLRFYSWQPHCLSLGYGQRCRVVDMERLLRHGATLVRRPSGGGAILHAEELTWSLILPAGHPLSAGSLSVGYQRISQVLYKALQLLGIPVIVKQEATRLSADPACFATPAQYELAVAGRKLLGSARVQRRYGMLQHGSLPLTGDVAAICQLLRYSDDSRRELAAAKLREGATTLAEASGGKKICSTQVIAALVNAFRTDCDVDFLDSDLTRVELKRAAELESERYGNPAWVCRR